MSVGVIALIHTNFGRAEQMINYWLSHECPVVVHVDAAVPIDTYNAFRDLFSDHPNISFSERHKCEWGTWGLVAAALDASKKILERHPNIGHVLLLSGSCLPLRSIKEFKEYLAKHSDTDFIESVNTTDVQWTVGGLQEERFKYYFPFPWRRRKKWFDLSVRIQRRIPKAFHKKIPTGLMLYIGSQWWCLTSATLTKILHDPQRPAIDKFFKYSWIPDESYFQTMARKHSSNLESRSLTLSKFDQSGRPHLFYDDHFALLKKSDCFIARKIWPGADLLYNELLNHNDTESSDRLPNPAKIDRIFDRAFKRRTLGRPGLYMAARFPTSGGDAVTARPYNVFWGFNYLYKDFESWLSVTTGARVHGHIFAPEKVYFAEREASFVGAMSDSAWIRDYNPASFLSNLIWNSRGERQVFQLGPRDNKAIWRIIAADKNANINIITGAFFVDLSQAQFSQDGKKVQAARFQSREDAFVRLLAEKWTNCNFRIWSLSDFLESPRKNLQNIVDEMAPQVGSRLSYLPNLSELSSLAPTLKELRNSGINPYMVGSIVPEAVLSSELESSNQATNSSFLSGVYRR